MTQIDRCKSEHPQFGQCDKPATNRSGVKHMKHRSEMFGQDERGRWLDKDVTWVQDMFEATAQEMNQATQDGDYLVIARLQTVGSEVVVWADMSATGNTYVGIQETDGPRDGLHRAQRSKQFMQEFSMIRQDNLTMGENTYYMNKAATQCVVAWADSIIRQETFH